MRLTRQQIGTLSTFIDSCPMGRLVDLDDLIDVGEVAVLLGLAHKNSVTTYMRRYDGASTISAFRDVLDGSCLCGGGSSLK